jgi:tight adherence protein C
MSPVIVGGLLGAVLGVGLVTIAARLLGSRRPSLESRVVPYIRDVPSMPVSWSPRPPSSHPSSALVALVRPTLERWADRLERILGGRASIQRRLDRAGTTTTVEGFRFSQVVWGLSGFGIALAIGVLGPARQPGRALRWLLISVACGVAAVLARDSALTHQVRRREDQMLVEFPVVADLMALSVAAGEGPASAIDRVVRSCRGALPDELAVVLAQSRTGVPITEAAIERGTPLVDVLAAQAADVREAAKRALIETGARKEIAMMVPVVFLIMPVTLLFAFFPGVVGLNVLAP